MMALLLLVRNVGMLAREGQQCNFALMNLKDENIGCY